MGVFWWFVWLYALIAPMPLQQPGPVYGVPVVVDRPLGVYIDRTPRRGEIVFPACRVVSPTLTICS